MLIDPLSLQRRVWQIHYEYSRDTHTFTHECLQRQARVSHPNTHTNIYLNVKFTAMKVLHIIPGDCNRDFMKQESFINAFPVH